MLSGFSSITHEENETQRYALYVAIIYNRFKMELHENSLMNNNKKSKNKK